MNSTNVDVVLKITYRYHQRCSGIENNRVRCQIVIDSQSNLGKIRFKLCSTQKCQILKKILFLNTYSNTLN